MSNRKCNQILELPKMATSDVSKVLLLEFMEEDDTGSDLSDYRNVPTLAVALAIG